MKPTYPRKPRNQCAIGKIRSTSSKRLEDTERRLATFPISERRARALDKTLGEGDIDNLIGDRRAWIKARGGQFIKLRTNP